VGPLKESREGYKYLLVIVCKASGSVHLFPTKTKSSLEVAKCFLRFGLRETFPKVLHTDNAKEFVQGFMQKTAEMLSIKAKQGTPWAPWVNGGAEAKNLTIVNYLRILSNGHKTDWPSLLPFLEFVFENSVNTATGVTPKFFNTGFDAVDLMFNPSTLPPNAANDEDKKTWKEWAENLSIARELAGQHMALRQDKFTKGYDRDKPVHSFKVGDKVMVWFPRHQKLDHMFHGPYIIEKFHDNIVGGEPSENPRTVIASHVGQPSCKEFFHVDRLKKFDEVPQEMFKDKEMLDWIAAFRPDRMQQPVSKAELDEVPEEHDLRDSEVLDEDEFEVERILDHRDRVVLKQRLEKGSGKGKKKKRKMREKLTVREYLVRFTGYYPEDDLWINGDELWETAKETVYNYCVEKGLDGVKKK
jgi:hypothetical protein